MQIVIVNKSVKIKSGKLALIAAAINTQIHRDVAPAWDRQAALVVLALDERSVPKGSYVIYLFDHADQADALGYHDQTPAGVPYGKVFVDPILESKGDLCSTPNSVSVTISHEVIELFGDPNCNLWADAADGMQQFAVELCDAVEGDAYAISVSGKQIMVSNFCLPAWFDSAPEAGAKFDFCGKLTAPFTMTPGGYVITRSAGEVTNLFASKPSARHMGTKQHPASRTARRQRGAAGKP